MTGLRRRPPLGSWIIGVALWLMIASSIGLEHGHSKLADGGTLAAVALLALFAGAVVLRMARLVVVRGARTCWAALRRTRKELR